MYIFHCIYTRLRGSAIIIIIIIITARVPRSRSRDIPKSSLSLALRDRGSELVLMEEQDQDINGSTMYLTDIAEEGDRFGVSKGSDGEFHAISKEHACTDS